MDEIYPDSLAQEAWTKDNIKYYLVHQNMGHWCGYFRFETRPVIEQGYSGILTYVPVHGGITFAEQEADGTMVYGFDCAHAGDDENPDCWDLSWLREECERMAVAILHAVQFEKDYLLAGDNEGKAKAINSYHESLREKGIFFELKDNFGSMISLLCGKL